MKKLIALLLALVMVLGMVACGAKTEDAPAADAPVADAPAADAPAADAPVAEQVAQAEKANDEAITVTYFCTVGAYLDILVAETDKWNATEGAEKGVYLEITSNINSGADAIEVQMQAGNHWDIMDGASRDSWIMQGWTMDLLSIDDPELQALIESYMPYIEVSPDTWYGRGILPSLPLEVVPIKMAVNLDLLEAAGKTLDDIKTWEGVVETAQAITEASNGEAWGFGLCNWGAMFRRLVMKASSSSNEKSWWDPNTQTYSFGQYEEPIEAIKTMYENGWTLGLTDLAIDPIRAEFSAGRVGMFPAPSYDYAVYTVQFPTDVNFTFVDMPVYGEDGGKYKGVWLDRANCGIDKVNFEAADDAKKQAIIDAFLFLNSDELYSAIYAQGGMIPYKQSIIESTELQLADNVEQWAAISDTTNFTSMFLYPDGSLPLEGDTYETMFAAYVGGNLDMTWDEMVADLEERYNAAWAAGCEDPDLDLSRFTKPYDHSIG